MPEIEITPEQEERLRALQEEIARDVVGKYGHVRPRDAVEYLLDRYETDDDADPAGERVEAAGGADATDAGTSDASGSAPAPDAAASGGPDGDDTATGGPAPDATATGGPDADDAATDGEDATARVVADDGGDGDDAMLDEMMSLLDTHGDKWGESSGDERYVVELPDGSSEQVRTKDDVKALLFKHYR